MHRLILFATAAALALPFAAPVNALNPLDDDAGSGGDAGDSAATALPIEPGTYAGRLTPWADPSDWYAVTLAVGQGYEARARNTTPVSLPGSLATLIWTPSGLAAPERGLATESGTWLFHVKISGARPLEYTLTFERVDLVHDDAGSGRDASVAAPVEVGEGSFSGSTSEYDTVDAYFVTALPAEWVEVLDVTDEANKVFSRFQALGKADAEGRFRFNIQTYSTTGYSFEVRRLGVAPAMEPVEGVANVRTLVPAGASVDAIGADVRRVGPDGIEVLALVEGTSGGGRDAAGRLYFNAINANEGIVRLGDAGAERLMTSLGAFSFGADGALYAAVRGEIVRFPEGSGPERVGTHVAFLSRPSFGPDGDLYALTVFGASLVRWNGDGWTTVARFGVEPRAFTFDETGAAYVALRQGPIVRVDVSSGERVAVADPQAYAVNSLAFGGTDLYAAVTGPGENLRRLALGVAGLPPHQPDSYDGGLVPDLAVDSVEVRKASGPGLEDVRVVEVSVRNNGTWPTAGTLTLRVASRCVELPCTDDVLKAPVPTLAPGERTVVEFRPDVSGRVGSVGFGARVTAPFDPSVLNDFAARSATATIVSTP